MATQIRAMTKVVRVVARVVDPEVSKQVDWNRHRWQRRRLRHHQRRLNPRMQRDMGAISKALVLLLVHVFHL